MKGVPLVIVISSLFASTVLSQEIATTQPQLKLEDFGIIKGSRFYKEPSNDETEDGEEFSQDAEVVYRGVVVHKQYEEGATISVKTTIDLPDNQIEELKSKAGKLSEEYSKKLTEIKFLPNCTTKGKETLQIESPNSAETTVIFKDILILRQYQVPEDTEEIFGPQVEVFGYQDKQEDPGYQIAHAFNARCLPWRVRIAATKTDLLFGKEALKNFSRNKKGILHREARGIIK